MKLQNRGIRFFENFHIVLWLLKDTSWILNWKIAGTVMVAPTIALAAYIAWRSRRLKQQFMFNLAVCCWILANSTWMIGEFYFNDSTRPLALVFFGMGLLLILWFRYVPPIRKPQILS